MVDLKPRSKKVPKYTAESDKLFDVELFCKDVPISVLEKGIRLDISEVPTENHSRLYETVKTTYPGYSWVNLATNKSYLDLSFRTPGSETFLERPLIFDGQTIQPTAIFNCKNQFLLVLLKDVPFKPNPAILQKRITKRIASVGKVVKLSIVEYEVQGVVTPLAVILVQLLVDKHAKKPLKLKALKKKCPYTIIFTGALEFCSACNCLGHPYCGFAKSSFEQLNCYFNFADNEQTKPGLQADSGVTDLPSFLNCDFSSAKPSALKDEMNNLRDFILFQRFSQTLSNTYDKEALGFPVPPENNAENNQTVETSSQNIPLSTNANNTNSQPLPSTETTTQTQLPLRKKRGKYKTKKKLALMNANANKSLETQPQSAPSPKKPRLDNPIEDGLNQPVEQVTQPKKRGRPSKKHLTSNLANSGSEPKNDSSANTKPLTAELGTFDTPLQPVESRLLSAIQSLQSVNSVPDNSQENLAANSLAALEPQDSSNMYHVSQIESTRTPISEKPPLNDIQELLKAQEKPMETNKPSAEESARNLANLPEPMSALHQVPDSLPRHSMIPEPSSPTQEAYLSRRLNSSRYPGDNHLAGNYFSTQLNSPRVSNQDYNENYSRLSKYPLDYKRASYTSSQLYSQEPNLKRIHPRGKPHDQVLANALEFNQNHHQLHNHGHRGVYTPGSLYNPNFLQNQSQLTSDFGLAPSHVQDYASIPHSPMISYPTQGASPYLAPQVYSGMNYSYNQSIPEPMPSLELNGGSSSYHLPYPGSGFDSRGSVIPPHNKYSQLPVQFQTPGNGTGYSTLPTSQALDNPNGAPGYSHQVNFPLNNSMYSNSGSNSVYQ